MQELFFQYDMAVSQWIDWNRDGVIQKMFIYKRIARIIRGAIKLGQKK